MAANDQITGEEQTLWGNFIEGDDSALERLYRQYFEELHAFGMKWLNDIHLTEDAIQDLFIKLMKNRKNLSVPVNVKFYLFRAFRSNVLDKIRSRKKRQVYEIEEGHTFLLDLNPDQRLINSEKETKQMQQLQMAIESLTSRQKEAIYLRYIKGFRYREVAAMMELTDKGTYKLMARAIQALKDNIPDLLTISISLILQIFIDP